MGAMPCELLKPNSDELYNLQLDSETSNWGYMSCRMTGTYIGHHNMSYILDADYGRSFPEKKLFWVSSLSKLSMFQTFAEVTAVSPSQGSVMGGTLLTIQGRFFDQTDEPARVLVGGRPCEVHSVADDRITCRTAGRPVDDHQQLHPDCTKHQLKLWVSQIRFHLGSNHRRGFKPSPPQTNKGELHTGASGSTSWLANSLSRILYLMLSRAPPGGRGLKMDLWSNKLPRSLDEIWSYNQNTSGYRSQWIDFLPHVFPMEDDLFASRTRGFLVPPLSGNFNIYLHCDDRCDLYLSNSSRPEDKVKVAFQPRYVRDFFQLESQKSEVLFLEKGKPYYLELLLQEYYGIASLNIGLFQEESSFTAAQSDDAINEIQNIVAEYEAFDEEQVPDQDSRSELQLF
ncbi:hypothetical protein CCH79_00020611 [Gambusia affinis]|uniref:PA14 domain-containing protein n=1 Tax=Gambusia affinis TaxID=33528 RepID=A0A315V8F9_GAMAF|nr:hypothetical protein CCH79_00020611 [Gambusia affinis]